MLYFPLFSAETRLTKSSHCPGRDGVAGCFRADAACGAHTIHTALSCVCVCVCFRERELYSLTTAALRIKSFLSAASEGCHYCWALDIIIRGCKLHRCQGWSARHKGSYYFAELFGRQTQHLNNLAYEACDSKMNLDAILFGFILGFLFCKQEGGTYKSTKFNFCSTQVRNPASDFQLRHTRSAQCCRAIALYLLQGSSGEICSSPSTG